MFVTVLLCLVFSGWADRRQIKDVFGRYVSPQVAQEVLRLSDTDQLALGGVKRDITVLFADIRGFTALSEQYDPELIVAMLNHYFSVIVGSIFDNNGMVNDFAGDNVMAVWNAPQD